MRKKLQARRCQVLLILIYYSEILSTFSESSKYKAWVNLQKKTPTACIALGATYSVFAVWIIQCLHDGHFMATMMMMMMWNLIGRFSIQIHQIESFQNKLFTLDRRSILCTCNVIHSISFRYWFWDWPDVIFIAWIDFRFSNLIQQTFFCPPHLENEHYNTIRSFRRTKGKNCWPTRVYFLKMNGMKRHLINLFNLKVSI